MKEYTIYLRHGNAKPYSLMTYKSLESAKIKVYDIVSLEIERKRPFFVDNDFFQNQYDFSNNTFYICILEREVSDWKKCYSNETEKKHNIEFLYKF